MGFARRRSVPFGLFGSLVFVVLAAFATQVAAAEIGGIDRVYLRDGPGGERAALGILDSGTRVEILGTEGSWTKVKTPDGKVGFVYGRYVQAKSTAETPSEGGSEGRTAEASEPAPAEASTAEPQSPAATPAEVGASQEIFSEIATLRGEIADLKQKVQEHSTETYATRGTDAVEGGAPAASGAGTLGFGARSTRDQSAGVLVIALLSLIVGWVLGSAFTRRRSRSQRPRLRL
jgi:hypothetical protein